MIKPSGSGTYTPAQGTEAPIELKDATPTKATGTKGGAPFTVMLQDGKLVVDGVTFTQS